MSGGDGEGGSVCICMCTAELCFFSITISPQVEKLRG